MKFLVKDDTEENQYFFAEHCEHILTATTLDQVLPILREVEALQTKRPFFSSSLFYGSQRS